MQELRKVGNLEGTSDEDFDRIYRVNVKGVYNCLSAALPAMKKADGSSSEYGVDCQFGGTARPLCLFDGQGRRSGHDLFRCT